MDTKKLKEILKDFRYIEESPNLFIPENENLLLTKDVENFGIQWNKFQKTQFDSHTGLNLSESRLNNCSEWNLKSLKGKLLLELGSGAGRFTEIFLKYGAIVVSVELSSAIYSNYSNNKHKNLILIKDSLKDFKFPEALFDYVFCYGVAQHLPNPIDAYSACVKNLKPSTGLVSIDHYWKRLGERIPCFFYYSKYLWRPITTKLNPYFLLLLVKFITYLYLPFDIILKKIFPKKLYKLIKIFIPIPVANFYLERGVRQDFRNLINCCIMDTFDRLGAKYDHPWTKTRLMREASKLNLSNYTIKVVTDNGNGLVLNGRAK